jgi:hypothetical protein
MDFEIVTVSGRKYRVPVQQDPRRPDWEVALHEPDEVEACSVSYDIQSSGVVSMMHLDSEVRDSPRQR